MSALNQFLTETHHNARQSLGLYRIIFSLGYLWFIVSRDNQDLWSMPTAQWKPLPTISFITSPPAPIVVQFILIGLIVSLLLLVVGFKTRWVTIGVTVFGMSLAAVRYSYGYMPHYALFMETYIPMTMILSRWGDAFSIDRRMNNKQTTYSDDHWIYVWPQKMILLILVLTFVSSGLIKLYRLNFILNVDQIPNILSSQTIKTYIMGFPDITPQATFLIDAPLISQNLRFVALGFELFFWVALINWRWRYLFLSLAFGFSWFNSIFMNIYFTQMLLTYVLFVNLYRWQGVVKITTVVAVVSVIVIAIITPLPTVHQTVRMGIWYLLSPLVIYAVVTNFLELIRYYRLQMNSR